MTQTLLIGLDGATFTVLDDLTRDRPGEGVVMPFLASLMKRGYRAPLRSTRHPLTPPAWVSLMTGRSPGHHGVYDFVRLEDHGDEVYFTLYDRRDIRVETIWSHVSRAGRSVVSLNFPMMAPPPDGINGSLLPGFVSWKHLRKNAAPEALYDRIKAIPGFNPKDLAWDFERESKIGEPMTPDELVQWVEHHLPREDQWFRIAHHLLTEDNPDLFAIMFDGTDKIQHQCWHVLDPALYTDTTDKATIELRRLVLTYFQRLDSCLEDLVHCAGPETHVFLASDHGFTANVDVVRINAYLAQLGHLVWHETDGSEADRKRENSNIAYLDWSRTLAYCPTPSSNGIHIRVAEKPGAPGVPPDDYARFRDQLIGELLALRHDETGEPVIAEVLTREEAFPGPAMGEAPDLTLVLRDHGFVSVRNRAPVVEARPIPLGTHHPDGIFIAAGPGIEPGRGEHLSIIDVPSILVYTLGLPIPEDYEGQLPTALFTADWLMHTPPRTGTAATPTVTDRPEQQAADMSDEEKDHIMDQLRALGYMED